MPYIIAIIIVLLAGITFTLMRTEQTPANTATQETVEKRDENDTTAAQGTYIDGTYTAKVTYPTPKRDIYALDVTLVIVNDIITDSSITYSQGAEKDGNVERFDAAYRTELLGKNIDDVNLSRVGGASLTTNSFNEAFTTIKADAKS